MFVSPIDPKIGKRAWDNCTIYDNGKFYAFFSTGFPSESNPGGRPTAIDIAVSDDGVHWRFLARDLLPIAGAHAGYGVVRIGDRIMYYPTCSDKEHRTHFKVYASRDFVNWEHLGDEHDCTYDPRYYAGRWDEVYVLPEKEDGKDVYYGYISSEVREDIGAPSVGMMKSYDGVSWEVLPPPVVEWGEIPAHHMELNFCEKLGDKYYLSMSGRFYLDSHGYSLFTFVGDSPRGPFKPDREMFRLSGTSRRSVTWLGHTIPTPDDMLVALWLSTGQPHDLPSDNFGIGPLKRLACEDGHLRLRYWPNNDRAKGAAVTGITGNLKLAHPAAAVKTERDSVEVEGDAIAMSASRDGAIAMLNHTFDQHKGFVIEGHLTAWEGWGNRKSHQHAAAAGFFFESADGTGLAMLPDTLGATRTGTLRFADHRITDKDIYELTGKGLTSGRSGEPQGTSEFIPEDTVGPFGHASYCGIRHGQKHLFRLIARGRYFELYIDDYYVQTYVLPEPFTGRVGLAAFDGTCRFEGVKAWELDV
ncbi:MAG: hypothetical protein GF331_08280 [Chitinivibrionales bacterium]|nr:hypothetical protein [Chitinivibrionales bacterium]